MRNTFTTTTEALAFYQDCEILGLRPAMATDCENRPVVVIAWEQR